MTVARWTFLPSVSTISVDKNCISKKAVCSYSSYYKYRRWSFPTMSRRQEPTQDATAPPPPRWIASIPMTITWIRIALAPLFVTIFYLPIPNSSILCLIIFLFASFSDYLDGYLARKWNCTSSFGSFLDPVADKLLVSIAFILLTARKGGILLPICTSLIVSREIFVSAWREWMTAIGKRESVSIHLCCEEKMSIKYVGIGGYLGEMEDNFTNGSYISIFIGYEISYIWFIEWNNLCRSYHIEYIFGLELYSQGNVFVHIRPRRVTRVRCLLCCLVWWL